MKAGVSVRFFRFRLLFSAFALVCLLSLEVYANIVDVGGGGLVVSPEISASSSALFSYSKMVPGDSVKSAITVKNTLGHPFSLSVEIRNRHNPQSGRNLAEKLIFSIYDQNNAKIAECSGLASPAPHICEFPRVFLPAEEIHFIFEMSLTGSAGNEYQNTSARLEFVFTATLEAYETSTAHPPEKQNAEPVKTRREIPEETRPETRGDPQQEPQETSGSAVGNIAETIENTEDVYDVYIAESIENEEILQDAPESIFLQKTEETEETTVFGNVSRLSIEIAEHPKKPEKTAETKTSFEQFVNFVFAPTTGESLGRFVLMVILFAASGMLVAALKKKVKK